MYVNQGGKWRLFVFNLKTPSLWTPLFFTNFINFVIHFRSKWWGVVYSLPSFGFIRSFISFFLSLFSSTVGIQHYISFRYAGSFISRALCTWRADRPPCGLVHPRCALSTWQQQARRAWPWAPQPPPPPPTPQGSDFSDLCAVCFSGSDKEVELENGVEKSDSCYGFVLCHLYLSWCSQITKRGQKLIGI